MAGGGLPVWEVPRDSGDGLTWFTSFKFATWAYNLYGVIVVVNGRWYDPHIGDYTVDPDNQSFTLHTMMALRPGEAIHVIYWPKSPVVANPNLGARRFDGAGDYISYGTNAVFRITGDLTLAAWVRVPSDGQGIVMMYGDAVPGGGTVAGNELYSLSVVGSDDDWGFYYYHENPVGTSNDATFSAGFPTDAWRFIAVVRDTGAQELTGYIGDGLTLTPLGTVGYTNQPAGGTDPTNELVIGNAGSPPPGGGAQEYKGDLQEHYIWNRVLGETELAQAMVGQPPASGLVLSVRILGNDPEHDESPTGASGAVTGTTVIAGRP